MINSSQAIAVLEEMYRFHASWASGLELACHKGCAACCTRNVTITGLEGQLIVHGLWKTSQPNRLKQRLQVDGPIGRPAMTTNEWAGNCLEGRDIGDREIDQVLTPCPFLDQNQSCSIYPLRPFACRCFASNVDCAGTGMAEQPDILMEINTVTLQLIEHLDRGGYWGNMLDVLSILIGKNESGQVSPAEPGAVKADRYLRRARPLPGFLVMPDQQAAVQAYLTDLFALRIGRSTIGALLEMKV